MTSNILSFVPVSVAEPGHRKVQMVMSIEAD
ncbi:hypothetical protein B0I63_003047 [Clostridium beijerinckii]|uniref:Uncharacterized protein n=1 Tax=Clostridium beijerinckii TaxID=1520 RepID=A0A9Q5CLH3_CLOBE|nr:hypothetical protein [Clostridium beijerinckii]MBA2909402.1 hypothetical protein [Clostridium beijerinckii]MBA9014975.1 hypothetical protein [Clostridium beijerinckii]NRT10393.1 hypothetical protein [Clostridium beijerinckii]NRT40765.1 hypothetical protein [Clostridium beijerinckii]